MAKTKRTIQDSPSIGSIKPAAARRIVRSVHVAPGADGWVVVKPGRVSRSFESKEEAVTFARTLKREPGGKILLHERDGKVVPQPDRRPAAQRRRH